MLPTKCVYPVPCTHVYPGPKRTTQIHRVWNMVCCACHIQGPQSAKILIIHQCEHSGGLDLGSGKNHCPQSCIKMEQDVNI